MKYCNKCGAAMGDADKFCPSCGAKSEFVNSSANEGAKASGSAQTGQTSGAYTGSAKTGQSSGAYAGSAQTGQNAGAYAGFGTYRAGFQYDPVGTVDTLAAKMRTLATAWLVIGIVQIVIGTVSLCVVVGIAPLVMGICNLVQSSNIRKQAESFQQWPVGIIKYFESREATVIVFLILNIVFGLLFAIIGSVIEFMTKSYAMDHREELRMAEEMANRSAQQG